MQRRLADDGLPRLVQVNPCDAARGMLSILFCRKMLIAVSSARRPGTARGHLATSQRSLVRPPLEKPLTESGTQPAGSCGRKPRDVAEVELRAAQSTFNMLCSRAYLSIVSVTTFFALYLTSLWVCGLAASTAARARFWSCHDYGKK